MTEGDYGKVDKRVVFVAKDHEHAKFFLKLKHDGFTQAGFFRAIMDAYINDNDAFMKFVDEIKPQSKAKRTKSAKLNKAGKDMVADLGLNEGEVENIFDILEQEFPDL